MPECRFGGRVDDVIKTLVVTATTVYPPTSGARLRSWQHINILSQVGPVGMFSVGTEAAPVHSLRQVAAWMHHRLIPNHSTSIQRRLMHFTRPARWWTYPNFHSLMTADAAVALQNMLDAFEPDVAILDRAQLYEYVPLLRRNGVPVIWDTHNVPSSLVGEMNAAFNRTRPSVRSYVALHRLRTLERKLATQASQVWVCSDDDARRLARVCGRIVDVRIIPNAVDLEFYGSVHKSTKKVSTPSGGPHLYFAGVLSYEPNRLAAEFLVERIYPMLRSMLPHARCSIIGQSPSRRMSDAAARDPSIDLLGAVEDVRPFLAESDIVVVPLMQGGGTRLKILEAFAARRPVVSTTKGSEGLRARSGKHLLLADDPESMVAAIARIWLDESLRESLTEAAYSLVASEYSWSAIGSVSRGAVEQCVAVCANS